MFRSVNLLIAGVLLPFGALAETFDVPIDSAQSGLSLELCIAGSCDADSSAVAGFATIELDSVDGPTQISLYDFDLTATSNLHLYISWSFLGDFTADLNNLALHDGTPGVPVGPYAVAGGGAFTLAGVPADMTGTYTYTASGIPCIALQGAGYLCSDSQDLADMGTQTIDAWNGRVTSQDRVVTLVSDIDVTTPLDPNNPDLGSLHVFGTVRGSAYVPVPGDVDLDGDVDLSDLAALLGAYGACTGDLQYNPAADFDSSGCIDLADLAELLENYGYGT